MIKGKVRYDSISPGSDPMEIQQGLCESNAQNGLLAYTRFPFECDRIVIGRPLAQVQAIHRVQQKIGSAKEDKSPIIGRRLLAITEQGIFEVVAVGNFSPHNEGYL